MTVQLPPGTPVTVEYVGGPFNRNKHHVRVTASGEVELDLTKEESPYLCDGPVVIDGDVHLLFLYQGDDGRELGWMNEDTDMYLL